MMDGNRNPAVPAYIRTWNNSSGKHTQYIPARSLVGKLRKHGAVAHIRAQIKAGPRAFFLDGTSANRTTLRAPRIRFISFPDPESLATGNRAWRVPDRQPVEHRICPVASATRRQKKVRPAAADAARRLRRQFVHCYVR